MTCEPVQTSSARGRRPRRVAPVDPQPSVTIRTATVDEAPQIYALIMANLHEGHLLPRTLPELTLHAERFVVGLRRSRVVACAELAPLSHTTAEVRSLVVTPERRGSGVGRLIVEELHRRARRDGFEKLCAFTHQPGYFVRMGFSIVPHVWLPEKIATDCRSCALFRACGQYAMVVNLDPLPEGRVQPASLHA